MEVGKVELKSDMNLYWNIVFENNTLNGYFCEIEDKIGSFQSGLLWNILSGIS